MAYDKVFEVDGTDDYRQPIEASIDASPQEEVENYWRGVFADFRQRLRTVLAIKGIKTNPGSTDDELIGAVDSLAAIPSLSEVEAADKAESLIASMEQIRGARFYGGDRPKLVKFLARALQSVPMTKEK